MFNTNLWREDLYLGVVFRVVNLLSLKHICALIMFCNFIFRTTNLFVNLFSDCIIIKLFYITKVEASKELCLIYLFSVSHEKHIKICPGHCQICCLDFKSQKALTAFNILGPFSWCDCTQILFQWIQ